MYYTYTIYTHYTYTLQSSYTIPWEELKPVRSTYATAPWSGGTGTPLRPPHAAKPSTVTYGIIYYGISSHE